MLLQSIPLAYFGLNTLFKYEKCLSLEVLTQLVPLLNATTRTALIAGLAATADALRSFTNAFMTEIEDKN